MATPRPGHLRTARKLLAPWIFWLMLAALLAGMIANVLTIIGAIDRA